MNRRRYTLAEIAANLDHADAMSTEGRPNAEIARVLGVSVMTYHRWRKSRDASQLAVTPQMGGLQKDALSIVQIERISKLQVENSRLRRLVTDLLLEKITLEESIPSRSAVVEAGSPARTAKVGSSI